jgi:serine/threonine-protein kinase
MVHRGALMRDPFEGTDYRLVEKLGEGRLAVTFEVEHVPSGERRAAKLVRRAFAEQADAVRRLKTDAEALRRLSHPNIVRFLELAELLDGRPFVVTERLHGPTLNVIVRKRVPSIPEAVRWTSHLASALSAAHAIKVVHRDLHLGNLLLHRDARGRQTLKVLDFGYAKLLDGSPVPALGNPTDAELLVGSPRFVAPEAVCSEPVTEQVDVYAAGLVLLTLLTGQLPFASLLGTREIYLAHVWRDFPRPSELRPDVPRALDDIVVRAVAKDLAERFRSAELLHAALKRVRLPEIAQQTIELDRRSR